MTAEDLKTILEIAQAISRLIPQIVTAIRYIHIKTMRSKTRSRQQLQRDESET